ncbi:DnaJ domain containing protein [Novymonas esmeraldas]|uniref:DnaJ domain containing protein n=1 Tax=Novymonas esmeraldas TaxID=1808958 RepID=A0AAW0EL67_9TRYP
MLHHRVVLFAAPLHGVELAGLLFTDYLCSSLFRIDVAEALSDVNGWFSFFRGGFRPSSLLHFYGRLLSDRILLRLLECGVTAACSLSGWAWCQDAVVFRHFYPVVCDYRYGRLWCTRLLRYVGRLVSPSFLQRLRSRGRASSTTCDAGGAPRPAASGSMAVGHDEANYLRCPPRPSRTDPFADMPQSCHDALRHYARSYESRPFYTAFTSGVITDVTLFVAEQMMWCSYFAQERSRRTSRWRLLKPFVADLVVVSVQSALSYAARVTGVLVGRRLIQEPTGGGIFWGEHLTLLLLSPGIQYVSLLVGSAVRAALEERHPRTVEDEMEDKRMEEEAEELARMQAATAQAAFAFTSASLGDATGHAAGHPAAADRGADSGVDYYAVLGVGEQSRAAEIKKAYRAKALQSHPDRVGKDAAAQEKARQQMAIINAAYDTLVDADKRAQYDATRRFSDGSQLMKRLETMTTAQLAAVSVAAVLGLGTLTVMSAYGQYISIYQRVTSLGRGPLLLFS